MADETANPRVGDGATQERFGQLALARMRKDDGRSLILYSHDEDGVDAAESSAAAPADGGGRA